MALQSSNNYYFTFGQGHEFDGYYVKLNGEWMETREKMFSKFGSNWAFQYTHDDWFENGVSQAQKYGYKELDFSTLEQKR